MTTEGGWDGGWEANAAAKRATWLLTTPETRLAWLADAVELMATTGLLQEDRQRRQRDIDERWAATAHD